METTSGVMSTLTLSKPFSWSRFLADSRIDFDKRLDIWESFALTLPPAEAPLVHRFPPGLYIRQITMPAGSIITSRIHKYEAPFFITKGKCIVVSEHEGTVTYQAPHSGITKPGTRRLLLILEDTIWTTVHPNPDGIADVGELTDHLTYVRDNQYLGGSG